MAFFFLEDIMKFEKIELELQDTEWEMTYTTHDRRIARGIVFDDDLNFYFVRVKRDDIHDEFGQAVYIETSGGGVEDLENLEDAIKRELNEELGVGVTVLGEIGFVSDYYNIIHRHNLNHYFLCKVISFGNKHLTEDEVNKWHLSTVKMPLDEAIKAYKANATTKIARLVYNREMPILLKAKEIIDKYFRG